MDVHAARGAGTITHYEVQSRIDSPYGKFALMELKIETGRTHHSVHMASLGHPVRATTFMAHRAKF
jgi:23S rRNA pseudouridine1911/1915/1917 synthase